MTADGLTDRWKNRRRMAWITLGCGLGFPALVAFSPRSADLVGISMPFYTFVSAVLASYFGWATADDKWSERKT